MDERNTSGTDNPSGGASVGGDGANNGSQGQDQFARDAQRKASEDQRRDLIASQFRAARDSKVGEHVLRSHGAYLQKNYGSVPAGLEQVLRVAQHMQKDPAGTIAYLATQMGLRPEDFQNVRPASDVHRAMTEGARLEQMDAKLSQLGISFSEVEALPPEKFNALLKDVEELVKGGYPSEKALAIAWDRTHPQGADSRGRQRTDFRFREEGADARRGAIRRAIAAHGGRPKDIGRS